MPEIHRPVRLLTFDLYDTLIELNPPRWVRLARACRGLGIEADAGALRDADAVSEDFFTVENGRWPIRDRDRQEREEFRLELLRRWLEAAGMPADPDAIVQLRAAYLAEFDTGPDHHQYRLFDDVMPALETLRAHGVRTAVISNADADVTVICTHFAFAEKMDLIVTSALVGYEKPDPRTFRAALDHFGIDPAETLHVGDQRKSDVVGARSVGMQQALIDRYDRHADHPGLRVATLAELANLVTAGG